MEQYLKGKKYLDAGNFESAGACFAASTAVECAYGRLALAAMTGADRSEALAQLSQVFDILEQQADSGNAEDCFILGRCYETGSTVEPDMVKAMAYYTRAGIQGHADAMFNLGCMFMHRGPEGGPVGAYWFEQAAALGHTEATQALAYYHRG